MSPGKSGVGHQKRMPVTGMTPPEDYGFQLLLSAGGDAPQYPATTGSRDHGQLRVVRRAIVGHPGLAGVDAFLPGAIARVSTAAGFGFASPHGGLPRQVTTISIEAHRLVSEDVP